MFSTNIRYGRSALESVNTCAIGDVVLDDERVHLAVADRSQRLLGLGQPGLDVARASVGGSDHRAVSGHGRLASVSWRTARLATSSATQDPHVVGHVADQHAQRQRVVLDQRRRGQHVVLGRPGSGSWLRSTMLSWCRPLRCASQISRMLAIACAEDSDAPLTNSVSA